MPTGALTGYVDVAQIVLYAFWIFFAGLIFYLRREDKREGYPLEADLSDGSGEVRVKSFAIPPMPSPKTYLLAHGAGTSSRPRDEKRGGELPAVAIASWPGAPLRPTGDPMRDGIGAGAYAERLEVPDLTVDGHTKIVPLRVASEYFVEPRDPDPRGAEVIAADGQVAGVVFDLWVDRSEALIRYLEVEAPDSRRVLVPMTLARVRPARFATREGDITERVRSGRRPEVKVRTLLARQFAAAPELANPDQVTLREEDRISAYFGGGERYAAPSRLGPVL